MIEPTEILIVDDEERIRASLAEQLTRDGYDVMTAKDGEAALQQIKERDFDLVLVDLKMPGMSGIELLSQIRRHSPDTVTIVLTGNASLETAVDALRHGAQDYLFKPCKPTELRQSIRRGLENRRRAEMSNLLGQLDSLSSNLEGIRAAILAWQGEVLARGDDQPAAQGRFLQRAGLTVDLTRHIVSLDNHLLDLSPTEFEILTYLVRQSPRVVSAQELMREVQGYQGQPWQASETVRQHIYRIRHKIAAACGKREVIRTVRGVGYSISGPVH